MMKMTDTEDVALVNKEPDHRAKLDDAVTQVQEKFMLPPTAVDTLNKLVSLHVDQLKVEADYRAEWLALKAKYYRLLDKFYTERSAVLTSKTSGNSPISTEGAGDENLSVTTTATSAPKGSAAQVAAAIPDFWLHVLLHHPAVGTMVEPRDEEILKYITDISYTWKNPDEQLDFSIIFKFAPNPFFTNTELIKTFHLEIDQETRDPVLLRSIGTKIDWKAGRDITTKTVTKKQKNKKNRRDSRSERCC
eukprot:Blabericola_migrator_1__924@NODE_1229_length_5040_cov_126_342248_g71_i1_p2_GENE_NODE_1229_length_5040_cov_126_342248_g71_i1NODE_1229_length_5040_cov_126_342248_g71_i1_p2_ORF_typecomplete_len248_score48_49NAP/PF00956_18/1_5e36_NODE_1229_length_5040_cov_126_342248_g71_i137274470